MDEWTRGMVAKFDNGKYVKKISCEEGKEKLLIYIERLMEYRKWKYEIDYFGRKSKKLHYLNSKRLQHFQMQSDKGVCDL